MDSQNSHKSAVTEVTLDSLLSAKREQTTGAAPSDQTWWRIALSISAQQPLALSSARKAAGARLVARTRLDRVLDSTQLLIWFVWMV